ncbi:MAG: Phosphorylase family [Caldanaerobacter subterraneus]|jgi:uridine phosphorylase|uniref:Uridine phosphorylase n=1 Tax=Caldanaerobacter subterraneus TaxID=911092 RepID=A0A101E4G8_9THEO|nr:nucleoside phosphorylase [Caldanaerobacter subterraneus]KUK08467.1 MAG: Phosphorylase family [Caldanaerobacter subterraneus]HBT48515.1 uridine phosphorylase [Caldanaerobacter subterraneus]
MKKEPPMFTLNGGPLFTQVPPSKVAPYVILTVRDPLGFEKDAGEEIASFMDSYEKIADTKMFTTYTGIYKGVPITVCSTGSGAPEAELALMDFILFTEATTFIRVGTSGSYQYDVKVGDIVITSAAVRDEGTSEEYVAPIYPAVSDFEVVMAMIQAAEELGVPYHVGITRSNDAIYCGEGRAVKGYIQPEHERIPEYWHRANVKNVEREASLILTLCNLFKKRGGAVCTVVDNELTGELGVGAGKENSIRTALEGLRILSEWDYIKQKEGKKYVYPALVNRA